MKPIWPDGMQMPVTTTCKASVAGIPSLKSIRAFYDHAISPLPHTSKTEDGEQVLTKSHLLRTVT